MGRPRLGRYRKRRPLHDSEPKGYLESDDSHLSNNRHLAVELLDRHGRLAQGVPTPADVKAFYNAADKAATKIVEARARELLKKHTNLKEFVMCMGSAFFSLKKPMLFQDRYGVDFFCTTQHPQYLKSFFDFLDEWDGVLKITGTPMRFTADGPKITNW